MMKEQRPSDEALARRLTLFREDVQSLEEEVGRRLVGQRETLRGTILAMIAGGHVLLEGAPGLGKTLLVRTLAEAVAARFSRIQFTPDLMPADLTGTNIMTEEERGRRRFEFQPGPILAPIVLADEINRATPKTQSALLEAMQEHSVTVGGVTHRIDGLFFVLATQNPLEMEGTYPLPEAQLDRFFFKILVPEPTAKELSEILRRTTQNETPKMERTIPSERILEMGCIARTVPIADERLDLAVRLVTATHPDASNAPPLVKKYVRYGASPRAAQAILLAAQISAILDGRFNVAADDLRRVAPMALRHRLILNFEARAERIAPDTIIDELL